MTDGQRSYTVVGAGAVGLLYGARLARAGHPVRWLVRSGAREIATGGLTVDDASGSWTVPAADVEVFTDPGAVPASDVVLVATKTTGNASLAELVGGVCGPGATVAVFQNGLGAEEVIRSEVAAAGPIVAGLCFVCAERTAPGHVHHIDYGAVTLAPLDAHPGKVGAADIAADLTAAGIDAEALPDLGVARWRKLVWNIPFNGLCTVLDARTDELLGDPVTRALVSDLMDEVIAGSAATGNPVDPGFRDQMLAVTDAMTPYAPSMKLDHDAGRPLEVAAIYDQALHRARQAGAPMVRAETLAAMLHHLDPARSAPAPASQPTGPA